MAGVADHSNYRRDPLGRLHRTGHFVGTTTFGTTAEAEAAIAMVRRVHRRITGTAPDGRPYQATDPHLLQWVHCTEVDSFLRARQRYGQGSLGPDEPDRYVDDGRGRHSPRCRRPAPIGGPAEASPLELSP
ncbi:MAG: oxygenase MpaB family protein [Acidimicrobiales bacterium]